MIPLQAGTGVNMRLSTGDVLVNPAGAGPAVENHARTRGRCGQRFDWELPDGVELTLHLGGGRRALLRLGDAVEAERPLEATLWG